MATYAIGDIQGCYQSLRKLLKKIAFNPGEDHLWLAGDLINRGPDSLATLEFVLEHTATVTAVLGNHDLHFLAVASGQRNPTRKDTFEQLLASPKLPEIVSWLSQQPLLHYDPSLNFAMAHAGILPQWSLTEALELADEVSQKVQSDSASEFFGQMYGNTPERWEEQLAGIPRLRFITNALTRMRYCYTDASLDMECKLPPNEALEGLHPWFDLPREPLGCELVFGHWASLSGHCRQPNLYALDTGCVWGGKLTALRLEDKTLFQVESAE